MAQIVCCLGGANCVWEDFAKARTLIGQRDYDVAACNDAGVEYPGRLVLWATLHPEKMPTWQEAREKAGHPPADWRVASTRGVNKWIDAVITREWNGSSGLFVAQVARRKLHADRIILCGVPMDSRPNRYRDETKWEQFQQYRHAKNGSGGWVAASQDKTFAPFVRSMSGWTAELLGKPTQGWLDF